MVQSLYQDCTRAVQGLYQEMVAQKWYNALYKDCTRVVQGFYGALTIYVQFMYGYRSWLLALLAATAAGCASYYCYELGANYH